MWGEAKLVPTRAQCTPSSAKVRGSLDGAASWDNADRLVQPGAAISGFRRPSRVGPGLEKTASDPSGGGAPGEPTRYEYEEPSVLNQLCRVTYAPTVVELKPVPGIEMSRVPLGVVQGATRPLAPNESSQIHAS